MSLTYDPSTGGETDTVRRAALASTAHVRLVLGAPGVGKTYFGCELAAHELQTGGVVRPPDQRVLFLTFARNAVARIRETYAAQSEAIHVSARNTLDTRREMQRVRIDTFAAFSWWLADAYARYAPGRGNHRPWLVGIEKRGGEPIPSGHAGYTFDDLHQTAQAILERPAIRELISSIYPLVIVDEHQDVDPGLHQIIKLLGVSSHLVLLRGPGQSVYGSLKGFDPDAVLRLTEADLKPEVFVIGSLGTGKSRYCTELAEVVAKYDSDAATMYGGSHAELQLIDRLNAHGVPHELGTHTGLALQKLRARLRSELDARPTVVVLTSTNSAAASVHRRLTRGSEAYFLRPARASLWFDEQVLLQYGRFILSVLPAHWVAATRHDADLEAVGAILEGLSRTTRTRDRADREAYVRLGRHVGEMLMRCKRPRPGQSAAEKLSSDLTRAGHLLRQTKGRLPNGMPSTPFEARDIPLLEILAERLMAVITPRLGKGGTLDVTSAALAFEKSVRQSLLLEKAGVTAPVQVMTIHKSKGREFDGVVLVLEDDPRALWLTSSHLPEQERVDLYRVAISRARHQLVVVALRDARDRIAPPLAKLIHPVH